MKLNRDNITYALISVTTAVTVAAVLITAFTHGNETSYSTYHINFCDDKIPGKIYVWENYQYHDKKLDEFQSNNNVEIISVTQDDDIFSYHVKCIAKEQ